ncbi:MAG: hypothetical protein JO332_18525 [Planctomycetaceae bacterium]|nr:hypothetical protein [Planctomycetaceae bacterium]
MGTLSAALLMVLVAQDDAAKMEWAMQDGDHYDLTWSYNEQRKREPGRGETTETHDKRDVSGELTWKADGILVLTLKKVVWNYGNQDFDIVLNYTQGKKLDPQLKMKIGQTGAAFATAKADADRMVDVMKKITEGEYLFDTVAEKGRTQVFWNGGNVRVPGNNSLLNRMFTHPLLPSGPVRVGQIFKDPLDVTNLTAGLTDVKEVESKVTAVGDKGLIAKGGVNIPVGKSIVANGQTQMMNGNFTYTCEWNYSPQQYLQGAKEESKFTKKVDAKGKDADFYRENFNHSIAQALTIKKQAPKPGEEKKPAAKPDEPKPDDKKPDEK